MNAILILYRYSVFVCCCIHTQCRSLCPPNANAMRSQNVQSHIKILCLKSYVVERACMYVWVCVWLCVRVWLCVAMYDLMVMLCWWKCMSNWLARLHGTSLQGIVFSFNLLLVQQNIFLKQMLLEQLFEIHYFSSINKVNWYSLITIINIFNEHIACWYHWLLVLGQCGFWQK